ncbi:hypothetical protein GIB67_020864 [Kingdonia uniflora]|uniref:Two-component response regulator n=1 Tax=Kingdonia uniflora TaxID=39325 RepID=A0A7J7M7B4_9MAGN|nr:hypothetical protein GIB67_020864 [Kingdonia uniflora]
MMQGYVIQMTQCYLFAVTTCCQATVALNLLRERRGGFDVVISDVHMPDMDGFKLLELVGLEMDLPVIMMSADGRTSAVMRGIKHGACDYLIKPVRVEELKNIWQHVIRKKWNGSKDEQSGSVEDSDRKRGVDDGDYASSVNEGTDGSWKVCKKRKDAKEDEDDGELDNEDPSASKKPRVVWSVELHQQFVGAVNQLGIDKAVPKRILELMNVPGLTRENVASHLQKFRLYLKRISGVSQQQGGISNSFYGTVESNTKLGSLGTLDIQALAASGQIAPQTLAALHAEVLGRPTNNLLLPTMDKSVLLQASLQGPKNIPVERGVAFGQPSVKCQSNISVEDIPSGFGTWPPNNVTGSNSMGNIGGLNTQNNNLLMQMLQQQNHQTAALPEPSHTITVQPSCVVVSSQSPISFSAENISIPLNRNSSFSNSPMIDCRLLSSQSANTAVGVGQISDIDFRNGDVLNGYSIPSSMSSAMPACSVRTDSRPGWQVQNSSINFNVSGKLPGIVPNVCDIQGSYASRTNDLNGQRLGKSFGLVGKGTSFPSHFAVDDFESPKDGVKQEVSLDFMENVGIPVQQYSANDLMSVLSK